MRNMEIVTKLNLLVCIKENTMGLVKTRRLAAMRKQQRAKAGMRMKALPKVTSGKGVRSPSRKPADALTSARSPR